MTCTGTFSKSCLLSSTCKRSLHWKQKCGETCDGSYFLWASSGPWPGMCVAVAQRAPREARAPAIAECPKFCPDGITLLFLGQTLPKLCILWIGLATVGEAQLNFIYKAGWRGKRYPVHTYKSVVAWWGNDGDCSWGALPPLVPPSQQFAG